MGVPISIDVIDAKGNFRNFGTTTCHSSGALCRLTEIYYSFLDFVEFFVIVLNTKTIRKQITEKEKKSNDKK
jgi:hypothetical protein